MCLCKSFPLDVVLELTTEISTVQNFFNLVLLFSVDDDRCRFSWLVAVDLVSLPRCKAVYVEYIVNLELQRELQTIIPIA